MKKKSQLYWLPRAIFVLSLTLFLPGQGLAAVETQVSQLAMGDGFACARTLDSRVLCWGNSQRVLANTPNLSGVTDLSAFAGHVCAVASGLPVCWGDNRNGQVDVPSDLTDVVSVTVGKGYSCAATETKVRCWGAPMSFGGIAQIDFKKISKISAEPDGRLNGGYRHLCVVDESKAKCFSTRYMNEIEVPANLGAISDLKTGPEFACGLSNQGWVCWGNTWANKHIFGLNDRRELADFDFKTYHSNSGQGCWVKDGAIGCTTWGNPPRGQIGVKMVVTGPMDDDSCAFSAEGVKCWGGIYERSLRFPIPSELQYEQKKINPGLLSTFLGCYSNGVSLNLGASTLAKYPDGSAVPAVLWGKVNAAPLASIDDSVKALPSGELVVFSNTDKLNLDGSPRSNRDDYLRIFRRSNGKFTIRGGPFAHPIVEDGTIVNCPSFAD